MKEIIPHNEADWEELLSLAICFYDELPNAPRLLLTKTDRSNLRESPIFFSEDQRIRERNYKLQGWPERNVKALTKLALAQDEDIWIVVLARAVSIATGVHETTHLYVFLGQPIPSQRLMTCLREAFFWSDWQCELVVSRLLQRANDDWPQGLPAFLLSRLNPGSSPLDQNASREHTWDAVFTKLAQSPETIKKLVHEDTDSMAELATLLKKMESPSKPIQKFLKALKNCGALPGKKKKASTFF